MNIEKITYWLTHNVSTGEKYHTFFHCIAGDRVWMDIILVCSAAIVMGYFAIAYSSFRIALNTEKSHVRNGLLALMSVFVLCSTTYAYRFVQNGFPAYKGLAIFMVFLVLCTFAMLYYIWRTDMLTAVFSAIEDLRNLRVENERQKEVISALRLQVGALTKENDLLSEGERDTDK